MRTTIAAALALIATCPVPASAFDFEEEPKTFEVHGHSSNLLVWRNDSDFDPTAPFYSQEGQSVGMITSYLNPHITYRPSEVVELFYEAEFGVNTFSRNNPDAAFPAAGEFMAYKHRQIWTSVRVDLLDVKAGYQRVRDPSDLFLSHWMGAIRADLDLMRLRLGAGAGQLPDSTFEGIDLNDNNFIHDNVTAGFWASYDAVIDLLTVDLGVWYVDDSRYVGHPLTLVVPYVGATYKGELFNARAHALAQVGTWTAAGVAGIDQDVFALAASARAGMTTRYADVDVGGFALSPDDDQQGNNFLGSFFYSGKNFSPTLLLTEDELRDHYDNYDERMSGTWGAVPGSAAGSGGTGGPFFVNRAGLAVADVALTWRPFNPFESFSVKVIAGAGVTLERKNSLGSSYAGFESDVVLRYRLAEQADAVAVGQLFLPGKAAAAFINATDRQATEQVHGFQAGLIVSF